MFQPTQGSLILGRYLLEHELERGGMSSVWVAADLKLQRSVAVKLLKTSSTSEDVRSRFEREAMAVAQLQSPHVVQIFDYGVEHDAPIIVMERLYGEDLRARLKREHRMPLAKVSKIVFETAKGLSEAHAAGIVHRDLKPGNIFFARSRQDEVVKLLDFGVAKAMDGAAIGSGPHSGGIVGTPHFMSPEQARGSDDIDHRSDLWSLGVIIYNTLTGRLPYGGNNTADVLGKICTERFAPPSAVSPDLPAALDGFMLRALARDAGERFSSAREMTAAFSSIMPTTLNPTLDLSDGFYEEDEKTTVFDPQQHVSPGEVQAANLPRPPPLPREFGPYPSDMPSYPSHPSTLGGSAMLDGSGRASPTKRLVVWSLASLLVAGVAVAGGIAAWSPEQTAPEAVANKPAVASPAAAPEADEEDEDEETSESEAAPSDKGTPEKKASEARGDDPAARKVATSKPSPRPTEQSDPAPRSTPKPSPPKPSPTKAKEPTAEAKPPAPEPDWTRSRF